MTQLRVGISACLLGHQVRYDGQHKLDRGLVETLRQFAELMPVCPETECGLPTPREPMRLTGDAQHPRLIAIGSGADHTEKMQCWIAQKLDALARTGLCGFVCKSKSPSSGRFDVPIFGPDGTVVFGAGLFAGAMARRFPLLPMEDEARLRDAARLQNFISRITDYQHWLEHETASSE